MTSLVVVKCFVLSIMINYSYAQEDFLLNLDSLFSQSQSQTMGISSFYQLIKENTTIYGKPSSIEPALSQTQCFLLGSRQQSPYPYVQYASYSPNGQSICSLYNVSEPIFLPAANISIYQARAATTNLPSTSIAESTITTAAIPTTSYSPTTSRPGFNNETSTANATTTNTLNTSNANSSKTDCTEWYWSGHRENGVYSILLNGIQRQVLCDMTTDGGGWTVFQKRFDGSVSFDRTWEEYKNGFGNPDGGEFWLGNEDIHYITSRNQYGAHLKIEATAFDSSRKYEVYLFFQMNNEKNFYKLNISKPVFGSSFLYHNGGNFSTTNNCSRQFESGWWFQDCFQLNFNGLYHESETEVVDSKGIIWNTFKGANESLKSTIMMMRPLFLFYGHRSL